jgi:hypothetical protein
VPKTVLLLHQLLMTLCYLPVTFHLTLVSLTSKILSMIL